MSLPLNRPIVFAISEPGAITPRGDDHREPVRVWQACAIELVLPNVAELEAQAEKIAAFCAQRAEYVSNLRSFAEGGGHDYYRWMGHAEARRQLSQSLGLPVAWPAEDQTAPAVGDDSYEAAVSRDLSVPYTDDGPRPSFSPELLAMVAAGSRTPGADLRTTRRPSSSSPAPAARPKSSVATPSSYGSTGTVRPSISRTSTRAWPR
ncbi:hypothetical protein [Streptomyces albipurpureus]|uniref:Uncharacterized protein n=1 Tax=Streptomyces albipurpureus TaxID=2897419 RepID=A0ABT0UXF3_9ACTN|nr:hypothetical protein [Streptomyces sp. CWNU-1]MCM2392634.1 hypothetical protein [Streptomyces sp. CWNU-1]